MGGCIAAALGSSLLASGLAGTGALLVGTAVAMRFRDRSSDRRRLVDKAVQQAAEGRKLAIYERTTGLLAYWYLVMRGEEECARAARYKRPLSLLLIEPSPESNDWAVGGQLAGGSPSLSAPLTYVAIWGMRVMSC